MFDIQSKFTKLAKKQENVTYTEEENQSMKTNGELTQMLKSADRT